MCWLLVAGFWLLDAGCLNLEKSLMKGSVVPETRRPETRNQFTEYISQYEAQCLGWLEKAVFATFQFFLVFRVCRAEIWNFIDSFKKY